MKKYNVTIRAEITKTIAVEANDTNQAAEIAHEQFSVLNDSYDEKHNRDALFIVEEA